MDSLSYPKKKYEKFIGMDLHNNLFFQKNQNLIKHDDLGVWEYANLELGNIESVSLLNPLQILVFYKETNTMVLLDRFLSEIKRVNFNDLPNPKVAEWVENTKNQEVWLYNSLNNELEFFNYQNSNSIATTIPLPEHPVSLAANFNTAYLLFKDYIKLFNNYGARLKKVSVDSIQKIEMQQTKLVAHKKDSLLVFNKDFEPIYRLKKPKNSMEDYYLSGEKLYIYNEPRLYIYSIISPSN